MNAIIFVGLQASGKSSFFVKNFVDTHIRINMDMLHTRHREKVIVDACIAAKQPIVIDNTNPLRADRQRYIPKLKDAQFTITGYFFQSRLADCLDRNAQRRGNAFIAEVGIRATSKKLELPQLDEGFDQLKFVRIDNGEFITEDWKNEI